MSKRDFYEVLGVSRTVTEVELKTAYRRLAMKHHPDRNPGDKTSEETFKEAKQAYEVLSDPAKRRAYDQHGHAAFESGMGGRGGAGFNDVGDIFGDIFGGGRARQPRRGADLRYTIELDLDEAVAGLERDIHVPSLVVCDTCHGSGSSDGKTHTCKTCHGHGRVRIQQGVFSIQQACPHCEGTGKSIESPCGDCHGNGRVETERVLKVKIPAGVDAGDRIRLTGEGEAGPSGAPSGDLYVDVQVRPHPIFQRDGDDLYCEVPIRFSQAALGATINVPTLDGTAEIRVPEETQTGKMFRLRGKGVKSVRSRSTGDLICKVVVETPVLLTNIQRELLEKFEETFAGIDPARHSPRSSSFMDGVKSFWDRITS